MSTTLISGLLESNYSFMEQHQRIKWSCFPGRLTFNHNVLFSNELNESLLPSLSQTSNIYCWRCLLSAGKGADGWRVGAAQSAVVCSDQRGRLWDQLNPALRARVCSRAA